MQHERRFLDLAQELSAIAKALDAETPLSLSSLRQTVEQFRDAWDQSCLEAEAEGVPPFDHDALDPLYLAAELAAARERRRIAAAMSQLRRLHDIEHLSVASFPPLADFRRAIDEALQAIAGGAAPEPILEPFSAAETLIERWDDLPDAEADELFEIVAEAFGQKFTTAAARGRLGRSEKPTPTYVAIPEPATAIEPIARPAVDPVEPEATTVEIALAPHEPDLAALVRQEFAQVATAIPDPEPRPEEPSEAPLPAIAPAEPPPVQSLTGASASQLGDAPHPAPPHKGEGDHPSFSLPLVGRDGVGIDEPVTELKPAPIPESPLPATVEAADPAPREAAPVDPVPQIAPYIEPEPSEPPAAPVIEVPDAAPPAPIEVIAPEPSPPQDEPAPSIEPAEPIEESPVAAPHPLDLAGLDQLVSSRFPAFFGSFIDQAQGLWLAHGGVQGVRNAIAKGLQPLAPLDNLQTDDALRLEALAILNAWERIKLRGERDTPAGLQALFRLLGCDQPVTGVYVAPSKHAVDTIVDLECTPIDDRDTVMVPQFGSLAAGRYRIVLAWERLSFQHMMRRIGASLGEDGKPVIVFSFRSFERAERLALARHTAADPALRHLAVFDELVLLQLVQQRGNRMKMLFDCILPFTATEPYSAIRDEVPSELFLGWSAQRQAMLAESSSHVLLVCGGRGVGKTALLKRLAGDHRADRRYRTGVYLNIAQLGRPGGPPTDALIGLVAEGLRDQGLPVVVSSLPDQVEHSLSDWLNEPRGGGRRRVLIALDDADAFVAADAAAGYPQLQRLSLLLKRLGRLVRVVLGGTRGVQRLLRDPASPVADIAEIVRLGFTIAGEDQPEAARLAAQPMMELGFRFTDPAAITALLTLTGEDPTLLREACERLLAKARLDSVESPYQSLPFPIGMADVIAACAPIDPATALAAKIRPTLDLDARFEILCLVIALAAPAGRKRAGQPIATIRDQALRQARAKFAGLDGIDAFRVVIEEMVDFGLLRVVETDRYALNDTVRTAFGSTGQMSERLQALAGG